MASNVKITSRGIQKVLRNYNPKLAFAEFIWNGFDAKATKVEINYSADKLGRLEFVEIIDNGYGIDFEKLASKFNPFYESEKAIEISTPKHTSTMHGKNGVGRLTFFTFAHSAEWTTTFTKNENLKSGKILINVEGLNTYQADLLKIPVQDDSGTKVRFTNVFIPVEELENSIIPFLFTEFCWFLELKKNKGFTILINGQPLDYTSNVIEYDQGNKIVYDESKTAFEFKYIQWSEALHREYSKYYFLNSAGDEVFKDYTTLNNKGDQFYHSVYIQSEFFNDFDFKVSEDDTQMQLFGEAKSSPEYKYLIKKVNEYLRNKRKPYLKDYASRLVEQYENEGVFPEYETEWEERFKKPQLQETIKGLYEAQPKLFSSLNLDQKKTFVRFLDLLLDSNERNGLFKIIDEIVDLEQEEREDLANLFKTTRLSRIIESIRLIEDRYKVYYQLKDLVHKPDLKADEVHHLQKVIENHYWFFGEQYHLLTAAEPKFEEALRRFIFHLTKNDTAPEIEHVHKLKEMDIFACRQNTLVDRIENIVVELKHPFIKLGADQYNQVYNYLELILKQPEFNAPNMFWEFHLVGNKFDSSNFIKNQINTNKPHGIRSLVMNLEDGRVKVFAKTWSEIFAEFEIKHKFLDSKLKLERDQLTNELMSAKEIVESTDKNSAVQPKAIKLAKVGK